MLGAVVPVYNVPGVSDLRFSADVLADIYLGKIANWNDPRIAKDNPGVKLPDQKIIVVHRSDGSGTSFIFTDYLSKVSKEWADGPGKGTSPSWPAGVGGKGNEGVAGLVRQLPGAIGYVELIYALQNHISFGDVKNAAGNWVKASIEASPKPRQHQADARRLPRLHHQRAGRKRLSDLQLHLPADSRPSERCEQGEGIKDMLSWIVNSGESEVSALSYAPLPKLWRRRFSRPSTH